MIGGRFGMYSLPGVGAPVVDRETDERLIVIRLRPETRAGDHEVGSETVAELNPEYDENAPVVDAVYAEEIQLAEWRSVDDLQAAADRGDLTAYAFPVDRLRAPVEEAAQ